MFEMFQAIHVDLANNFEETYASDCERPIFRPHRDRSPANDNERQAKYDIDCIQNGADDQNCIPHHCGVQEHVLRKSKYAYLEKYA